ncbi:MAG: DUF1761 domain-containing protein [Pseudomonadota bacterium]
MNCYCILSQVNYIGVLIATAIAMIIGFLWYSPQIFGNCWAKDLKLKLENMDTKKAMKAMFVTSITTFLEISLLGGLMVWAKISGLFLGIHFAFVIGLIVALVKLSEVLYEQKSMKFWAITAGYRMLYLLIAGALLGGW